MPVDLKRIPPPAQRPRAPVWWVWLLFLLCWLAAGTCWAIMSNKDKLQIHTADFWQTALILPALLWLILLALRIAWYKGLQSMADGWDNDREQILSREIQRGRRHLAILGVSLHTALRLPDDRDGKGQREALRNNTPALKTQPSWWSDEGIRHSRLLRIGDETPEQLVRRIMSNTLNELTSVLASVPAEIPLSLIIESDGSLSVSEIQSIWRQCLANSHIRQPVTYLEGKGLQMIDHWLDQPMTEPSLMLIVALQVAPKQVEGTAETVVSLLLASPQVAADLMPLALLHRPEQVKGISHEAFHYAFARAFDWAALPAEAVPAGWLVGIKMNYHQPIATGLIALSSPINIGRDFYNLDSSLGYPGVAAPWVAIAGAILRCGDDKSQLIVSGDGFADQPLWATVITPLPLSSELHQARPVRAA